MKQLLPLLVFNSACSIEDFCAKDLTEMTGESFGANAIIDRGDGSFDGYSKADPSAEMKIYLEDEKYGDDLASVIENYQKVLDGIDAETPHISLQDTYPDDYVCGETSFPEDHAYYYCTPEDATFADFANGETQSKVETCDFLSRAGFVGLYEEYLTSETQIYMTIAHEFGHLLELEHSTEVASGSLMDNGGLITPDLSIDLINQSIADLSHVLTCVFTDTCSDELSDPPEGWM